MTPAHAASSQPRNRRSRSGARRQLIAAGFPAAIARCLSRARGASGGLCCLSLAIAILLAPIRARALGASAADRQILVPGTSALLVAGPNPAKADLAYSIRVFRGLRLEPTAASFQVHRTRSSTPLGGSAYSFSATAIGVSALTDVLPASPIGFYVGGRFTMTIFSGTFMDQKLPLSIRPSLTTTDAYLGPVVGARFVLSWLQLAVELQVPFALWGDQSARTRANVNTPYMGATASVDILASAKVAFF